MKSALRLKLGLTPSGHEVPVASVYLNAAFALHPRLQELQSWKTQWCVITDLIVFLSWESWDCECDRFKETWKHVTCHGCSQSLLSKTKRLGWPFMPGISALILQGIISSEALTDIAHDECRSIESFGRDYILSLRSTPVPHHKHSKHSFIISGFAIDSSPSFFAKVSLQNSKQSMNFDLSASLRAQPCPWFRGPRISLVYP